MDHEAFFHRPATHVLIDELSDIESVVLYVGAGASIERTGADWSSLTAQLLDPALGNFSERREAVVAMNPQAASSAVVEQYKRTGGEWRGRLSDAIRAQLYRGEKRTLSYFNDRVLALANDLIGAGRQVVIVTPNYDSYILDALGVMADENKKFVETAHFVFGVEPDDSTAASDRIRDLAGALDLPGRLTIVHLHGLVHREAREDSGPRPVVSEEDYATTRGQSSGVLHALFSGRDVIIVGSSVTDPPLVQALVSTVEDRRRRFSVQSLQHRHTASPRERIVRQIEESRARHLGVRLVWTDFYFQIPQVLEEIRTDIALENSNRHYSDADAEFRYGQRLTTWWDHWVHAPTERIEERQFHAYEVLREALAEVRAILDAPADEGLRLEVWARWAPPERVLALFATSTGPWPDLTTMRRDRIDDATDYTATRAFVNGSQTYATAPDSPRWKSFLAAPVRLVDAKRVYLPVGAVSLSSMREQHLSSVDPRESASSDALLTYLGVIGRTILTAVTETVRAR